MNLRSRNLQSELMDDPGLSPARFLGSLKGLRRVNRVTGSLHIVAPTLEEAARQTRPTPLRVLDVACGGGDVILGLSRRFQRHGLAAEFHGCDINPLAVDHARRHAGLESTKVRFFSLDAVHDPLPEHYDIIMSSLFLHHLNDEKAPEFLRKAAAATRRWILIHDLVRSHPGYLLAYLGVRLLLCNDVCHHDGPRSVEAAFTIPEVRRMAESAGLQGCSVESRFPSRFLLRWRKQ